MRSPRSFRSIPVLVTVLLLAVISPFAHATSPSLTPPKFFAPFAEAIMHSALGTNGVMFVATWEENVYAIDLTSRQVLWGSNFPGTRYGSLVIGPDNTLLVVSLNFRALDGNNGQLKWHRDFTYGIGTAALGPNGTVFVAADSLYALELSTGREKWLFHRDDIVGTPAVSADGFVYVATSRAGMMAFDGTTGERQWTFRRGNDYFGSPVVGRDGTIYARTDQHLYSFDGITGRTNWVVESGPGSIGPLLGVDGTIYLDELSALSSFEPVHGERQWRAEFGSPLEAMTLAANGTIYVSFPYEFAAVSAATGDATVLLVTEARFFDIHLTADGTILLPGWGSSNGIVALPGGSALAPSAWPKARQNSRNSGFWELDGPPAITRPPATQWVAHGSNAWFRFYSPTARPLQVQWIFNGTPIVNATNEVLRLPNVSFAAAGSYSVMISNRFGAVTSDHAELLVGYGITVRSHGPGAVERSIYQSAYPSNSTVQLTAIPATNRHFRGWSGDILGSESALSVSLTGNVSLIATFDYQPGDILWEMPESFGSTPAIGTNGILYGSHWLGRALAVQAATGEILWDVSVNGEVNVAPSIAHDGTVFVGTYGSTVNALDGRTGTRRWGFPVGVCVHSCPAVGVDGTIYFAGDKLYAVDITTGAQKWSFATDDIFESSPGIDANNTVYIGSWNGSMYAFEGTTGRKKWAFATGGRIDSSPAVGSNGAIYFASHDHKIYALEGQTGEKIWDFDTGSEAYFSPVIGPGGTVYVGSGDYKMYALHGQTGAKLWEFQGSNYLSSSAVLTADATLLFAMAATESGGPTLLALDAVSGEERWRKGFDVGQPESPTVGPDGTIYFAGRALYGNSPPANSPWPKAHGQVGNRGRLRAQPLFDPRVSRLDTDGFNLTLHTELNDRVVVEWTTNALVWTPLTAITNRTGMAQLLDPAVREGSFRFYRARLSNSDF